MKRMSLLCFLSVQALCLAAPMPTDTGTGIVIGAVVNLRAKPSMGAAVISTLKEKAVVAVLERTKVKEKVGIHTSRWIKVRTGEGKTGYLFGTFVFEMDELYRGNWVTNSESGDTMISWSFKRGGTFRIDFTYPYESPGPGIKSGSAEGAFSVKGTTVVCTFKKATKEKGIKPGTTQTLHLFKKDEDHYLSYRSLPVDKGINFDSEDVYDLLNHSLK